MAKIMDPVLPILSILGYRAIILGSFGGPGRVEVQDSFRGVATKPVRDDYRLPEGI